jgi:hypothetical protein
MLEDLMELDLGHVTGTRILVRLFLKNVEDLVALDLGHVTGTRILVSLFL